MKDKIQKFNEFFEDLGDGVSLLLLFGVLLSLIVVVAGTCGTANYIVDKTCVEHAKVECREREWKPSECRDHACLSCGISQMCTHNNIILGD